MLDVLLPFSVIGYSNDTRTQTINEGESSILTVEIKKPAVGVGSQVVVDFQINSANSGKCILINMFYMLCSKE